MTRYSDDDRAAALEVLKAEGLPAAAASAGCSKSTIIRWARAAGLDPADYAERSTEQKRQAAAASVAARQARVVEERIALSDLLLKLAPTAGALLLDRLEEDRRTAERVAAAEERLEVAIGALAACADPPEDATPEVRKTFAEARKDARAAVSDARLVLSAWRDSRAKVPELVGVVTRAVHDHLALEGEAAEAATTPAGFTVVLSAPRPDRRNRPEPVTLEAEPERSTT